MTVFTSKRIQVGAALVVAAGATLAGLLLASGDEPGTAPTSSSAMGPPAAAIEVEHYASIEAMTQQATVVVLGRVADIQFSRTIPHTDSAGHPLSPPVGYTGEAYGVSYGKAIIEVDRVLAGEPFDDGPIQMEFMINQPSDVESMEPDRRPQVFFLRHKWDSPYEDLPEEREFYRLVSSQGLLVNVDGRVQMPTVSSGEAEHEPLPSRLVGQDFGRVVRDIERIGAE